MASGREPIIIAVHQLGFGGVTKAVLDQASMFRGAGRTATIATLNHDPGLPARVAELRRQGQLHPEVSVRNIYQDMATSITPPAVVEDAVARVRRRAHQIGSALHRATGRVLVEAGTDKHGAYRRVFRRDGELLAFERLSADGGIKHVNRFENRVQLYREDLHDGVAVRRTWFSSDGAVNREQFLAPDGFCAVQRWVNPETGKGAGVFVANRVRRSVRRFDGLPSWHSDWLQELVDESPEPPTVVAQSSSVIPKVMGLRPGSAIRMAMMHNSQVAAPFDVDSPLRPDYKETFERIEELDTFVVLSERQRKDMVARIGGQDVLRVVPNVMELPAPRDVPRDDRLVSIVSRLAEQKALHEAIEAFVLVLRAVPDARLEIYGRGPEKSRLEQLVSERGLGTSVHLAGRTDAPLDVMARSVCTVSTSNWEALPLSIAESLAVGTPVVAYDCLYGPSTLIRDGETGAVVPRGDREALAAAITDLLVTPGRSDDLGRAGRDDVKSTLVAARVLDQWNDAFDHARQRSVTRSRPI